MKCEPIITSSVCKTFVNLSENIIVMNSAVEAEFPLQVLLIVQLAWLSC